MNICGYADCPGDDRQAGTSCVKCAEEWTRILADLDELKERREDEEWLKGDHLRRVCWDGEIGRFEAVWEEEGESYFRTAPTLHAAIAARGGK